MNLDKVLLSGLTGTSTMTVFSYMVSGSKENNFKEPELLAALEKNYLPAAAKEFAIPAGWFSHYSIGIVWAFVYEYLWQTTAIKRSFKNALILGGLSGLTGIVIWKIIFKIHPEPPRIDFEKFYAQLLLAHVIYGLTVRATGNNSTKPNKGLH